MIKLSKKHSLISLAFIAALIMAMFPTSSFIGEPFTLNTNLKQQHYNAAGLFTVSPYEAAEFYSSKPSNSYWIDVRDASEYAKSHLKAAMNESLKKLESSSWNPDDIILVYGNNTEDAQQAAAALRQMVNARAFAVAGGFYEVKKYLMDPIGIDITSKLSDNQLSNLIELRGKLSGEKTSPAQLLEKLKSGKSKAVREGC